MNKNNTCLLLCAILLSFVNCSAMYDSMRPVKEAIDKQIVYKDSSSDESGNNNNDQVTPVTINLEDVNLPDTKIKHNPTKWTTRLADSYFWRGTLTNILIELDKNTFDQHAVANIERVNSAIDEAIKYDKPDELGHLITKLKNIDFSISKMTALNAQKYLEKAIIKKEDEFTVRTITSVATCKDNTKKEYEQMMKIALPIISSYHQTIKKQHADLKGDVVDVTSQLNLFKNAHNKTFQENYVSEIGYYTEDSLLQTTNTEELVNDTFKMHAAVGQRLEKITSALHGLLSIDANI